jgi:hypothetical protein
MFGDGVSVSEAKIYGAKTQETGEVEALARAQHFGGTARTKAAPPLAAGL